MKQVPRKYHLQKAVFIRGVVIMVLVVLAAVLFILAFQKKPPNVSFGVEGYTPRRMTIRVGETVTFSVVGRPFAWPASNDHPTHAIYSDFDPGAPIKRGETWQFQFNKPGIWSYHDHLAPSYVGRIIVLDEEGAVVGLDCRTLEGKTDVQKRQCFVEMLDVAVEEKSIAHSIELLSTLYATEPQFAANGCHIYAHRVGEAAYREYKKKRTLASLRLTPETISCGFGFYHGLIEHMFRDDPTIERGRLFCSQLENEFPYIKDSIHATCYHGLGHGLMPDPPPQDTWGNPQQIVSPALVACEGVSESRNPEDTKECMHGVFNVIADWMQLGQYGLSRDLKNPLGFCAKQTERKHALACYYEFAMRVGQLADDDIASIVDRFVLPLADEEYATTVFLSSIPPILERALSRTDYVPYIEECRTIPVRFHLGCVGAIVTGLALDGKPAHEYEKILALCQDERLVVNEREQCFRTANIYFHRFYDEKKRQGICRSVEARYQSLCRDV